MVDEGALGSREDMGYANRHFPFPLVDDEVGITWQGILQTLPYDFPEVTSW